MASKEQLRALRKKYGLGEFKKSYSAKRVNRKIYKDGASKSSMAKRRKLRRSYGRSRRSRSDSSSMSSGKLISVAVIGSAEYLLYKQFLAPKIPLAGLPLAAVEGLAGYWLAKRKGFIGDFGKVTLVASVLTLVSSVVPSLGMTASSSSSGGAYG